MTKRRANTEIEIGDIVEVISVSNSDHKGLVNLHGVLDNVWMNEGVETFTVLFDYEEFAYATEIKFVKKA